MPESQARTNDGDHADRRGIVGDAESLHGPFADYCKKRFLWYLALYTQTVETFVKRGAAWHRRQFHRVSFETSGNQMAGTFDFPDLQRRLNILEDKIMEETYAWPNEGLKLAKEEAPIAVNLRGQHEQIVAQLGRRNGSMIDLGMVDDNPFLWRMTYFGCPATLFDGGVLPIKIYISPRHPIEQPRVFVETPIFHVRVSTKKVLIYLPARAEEMWHHIDGIISSLEEEFPPFNPLMAVNAEAAKLCWGSKDDKKQYTRKLRRSIEATVE